ncbi:MAG: hypothetical protein E5X46_06070 [Mesorhizobium sp.]|nr:MAG: hypothetical protein EOR39_12220 [Mesorhizobium sp.]TIQ44816.1 MAG: hypothetical protein E5X47_28050 [Mesorhizobium sp.]TIQ59642.1 MAG: hypothetical protein E5X46_06070 [Mesorhizobium sp.]
MLLRGIDGSVGGCVRLLPSTGPTMLCDIFRLLEGKTALSIPTYWKAAASRSTLLRRSAANTTQKVRETRFFCISRIWFAAKQPVTADIVSMHKDPTIRPEYSGELRA